MGGLILGIAVAVAAGALLSRLLASDEDSTAGTQPVGAAMQPCCENVGQKAAPDTPKTADQIRQAIIAAANNAVGKTSGSSQILVGRTWGTDTDDGDGGRIRKAILVFHSWYERASEEGRGDVPEDIRDAMLERFSDSAYDKRCRQVLVDRIISQYRNAAIKAPLSHVTPPTTDQETLDFLEVRKQCKEWVDTIAREAGGTSKNYQDDQIGDQAEWQPGMGLYKNDGSHAMIITAIERDEKDKITSLTVVEANYADNWSNPPGDFPWNRTVQSRTLTPSDLVKCNAKDLTGS